MLVSVRFCLRGVMRNQPLMLGLLLLLAGLSPARPQDRGTLDEKQMPPLAHPDLPSTPAKELFARKTEPVPLAARSIGFYSHGCLAGAVALPIDGSTWQVMRLSRNRNWGHPQLIDFLERLAGQAKKIGWNGLLVGDLSQPRGGPMLSGHTSHQVGLDADIWLTPMPDRTLSPEEREFMSAVNMVREDRRDIDPEVWTHERKVRPWSGHDYHFHVRIFCPPDNPQCKPQPQPEPGDGCGHELDYWFSNASLASGTITSRPSPGRRSRSRNCRPRAGPS